MSFINEILPHAKKVGKEFNILVSLILAQAIHESNWGKSGLATKGFNLFGIKGTYDGKFVTMKTWEVYNGKSVYVDANFRKYPSWYESLKDLANLYQNGVSWDRNKYKKVIGEKDYKAASKAVQAAGYATDPDYATKLIKTIESNKLTQYDGVEEKTVKPAEEKVSAEIVTTPNKPTTKRKKNSDGKYTVVSGDTLSEIAADFNVSVKDLASWNKIENINLISAGQKLKFFAEKKETAAKPAASTTKTKTITIEKGDTLSELAIKYHTTVANLKELNRYKSDTIIAGKSMKVPATSNSSTKKYYTVKSGDNATKIAKAQKTTLANLKELNPSKKNWDLVHPGDKIRIK